MLELYTHRLRIAPLRVEALAVSSQNLLNTVGSTSDSVGDLPPHRRRQRQEPPGLLIGNVDAVKAHRSHGEGLRFVDHLAMVLHARLDTAIRRCLRRRD